MTQWMIYGANGYTGKLIADLAKQRGHSPILAGRNAAALKKMAANLGFEVRIFDLADANAVERNLDGVAAVLHCAGPFSATAKPMLEGCLKTRTHYLDITGEIEVFEYIHREKYRAIKEGGIVAIPGVGFDVVPTDCLAAKLKARLPDANILKLAFKAKGGRISPGTSKTMVESLGEGGRVRRQGQIVRVPSAYKTAIIEFEREGSLAVTIPWGDVSTAWYSTGIPNIEVYTGTSQKQVRMMQLSRWGQWLLKANPVQIFLKDQINKKVRGPNEDERKEAMTYVWGQVVNPAGKTETLRLITPEGYTLTADSALRAVLKVITLGLEPGPYTPSLAFGASYVDELEGVKLID